MKAMRGFAVGMMDAMSDLVQAAALLVALWAAWRCWQLTGLHLSRAGGMPSLPRNAQEWSQVVSSVRMMLLDPHWRDVLAVRTVGLAQAWLYFVGAVALTIFCVVGIRWAWARLRDVVAGV